MARRTSILFLLCSLSALAQVRQFKPGFNLFSKDQDIQLGHEAAAQVEKQMQVIHDPFLESYVKRVGQKLASQPQAGGFPYTFEVVNDPSINAFALPGGPTFVNTGLIKAVDNEAQLAGVLAHEISHVALRHGTNQASKANLLRLPAALAGAVLGGGGSMMGQLAQLGVGLGFNSVLLKFSRSAESDADLNGAQMMANAGYNPLELARFFEKLEATGGHNGPQFLSDHPNPGNRMKAIQEEIQQMPRKQYTDGNTADLQRAKQIVASLPAPSKAKSLAASNGNADPRPSGQFQQVSGNGFSLSYPSNWEVFGDKNGAAMTIAPRSALAKDDGGNVQVGMGLMVNFYFPPQGSRVDLSRDTQSLIAELRRGNPSMDTGNQKRTRVDGRDAIVTTLYSQSPYQGETEHDILVTVPRPEGLFYLVCITPARSAGDLTNTFDQVLRSVRFRD